MLDFLFKVYSASSLIRKCTLSMKYKGVPQATAEFEANGTGLFVTLGIG
jgi:hypothetical protein